MNEFSPYLVKFCGLFAIKTLSIHVDERKDIFGSSLFKKKNAFDIQVLCRACKNMNCIQQ